jgi:hypothetical protein
MSRSGGLVGVGVHFAAGCGLGRGRRIRQERGEGGKRDCIDRTVTVPG